MSNRRASASPIPELPPVTIATFASGMGSVSGIGGALRGRRARRVSGAMFAPSQYIPARRAPYTCPVNAARAIVLFAFVLVLGVPLLMRPAESRDVPDNARRLVVVTPHVQQIRDEFAFAFNDWHQRHYNEPVVIDFRTPGGTSEIIRLLQSQYEAAVRNGQFRVEPDGSVFMQAGTIPFDLMFGGGSYDHGRLVSAGPRVRATGPDGAATETPVPMSAPAGFNEEQLDDWYGENAIGAERLYHPEQYWLGTALSSFGIVYNTDILAELRGGDASAPEDFDALTDPRLVGWIALADPRFSGSITTTFDSILSNQGWDGGWRTLRAMSANTRYFTNSATKPPIDVSQGEAAAGLAIDFYGRGQAQSIARPGQAPETVRVGYVDPAGSVYIDADPVSLLRGGPSPELAKRFIEFCLTKEAQALWQFPARTSADSERNPVGESGERMGPRRHELRRLPVRRVMYDPDGPYFEHFRDRVDAFAIASQTRPRGWRSAIGPLMGAFAIDTADDVRNAWRALHRLRDAGSNPELADELEAMFFSMPPHLMPDGTELAFNEANYSVIRNSWRDPEHPEWAKRSEIRYAKYFRETYREITTRAEAAVRASERAAR
ncbi:MAG: extracellular solute-binding protein [Phycisphaerales bacterium]|nr:MAG: extracellular solute-binding protein [Phycisphaerales bacterium]